MDIMRGHVLRANDDRATDVMDADVLVLATDGIVAEVTSGGLTHTRRVPVEDMEVPVAGPSPLMRRLAHSIAGAPKRFDEAQERVDAVLEANENLASKIRDIRKWMIATHEAGQLHRSDLDTFLDEFGMEPYVRRWTGRVTITVSLTVDDARDQEAAEQAAYDWAEERIAGESGDNISLPDIARMTYNLTEDL